jgi:hypothetical protein
MTDALLPPYLREAFGQAIDSLPEWWEYGGPEPAVPCGKSLTPISGVFEHVTAFKDDLPVELLDRILQTIGPGKEAEEMGRYRTYGVAGQCLRRLIDEKKAKGP